MAEFFLGTLGFVLYIFYDVNSVAWHYRILQKCFALGSILVAGATICFFGRSVANGEVRFGPWLFFGAGAVFFFILLIYTLFFALPFDETYVKDSQLRPAYTEGVYALCRHPGVLWFAGLYLCLWGADGAAAHGIFYSVMIFWNILYIIFQDFYVFPKTFSNYAEYKKSTPFLIPNKKSAVKCLKSQALKKQGEL